MNKKKILFDNNAIDTVLKNSDLYKSLIHKYEFYVCTTVIEELANISDNEKEKRIKLFISFAKMEMKFISDSVFILDHSRLDCACLGNGVVYNQVLNKNKSNIKDAIIADTAVTRDCILLTEDKKLYKKMKSLNYKVITLEELETKEKADDNK